VKGEGENMNKHLEYIAKAQSYIQRSGGARLTAKEIAYDVGIDPSDFVRIFRRIKGITPKKYLDDRLKADVVRLVASGDLVGYKISYQLGFSSEQAFYRWVKRVFGISYCELRSRCANSANNSSRNNRPENDVQQPCCQ
jgi:methylphosphotriester-DNA--protein-cysteine methyltransferase